MNDDGRRASNGNDPLSGKIPLPGLIATAAAIGIGAAEAQETWTSAIWVASSLLFATVLYLGLAHFRSSNSLARQLIQIAAASFVLFFATSNLLDNQYVAGGLIVGWVGSTILIHLEIIRSNLK